MPPFHYPRFRIKRHSDGWHICWIPRTAPIVRVKTWPTFEEALAHIDILTHREPS